MPKSKRMGIVLLLCAFLLLSVYSFADTEVAMKGPFLDQHMETTISDPNNNQWEPIQDMTPSAKSSEVTVEGDDPPQSINSTTDENDQDSEMLPEVSRLYSPSLLDE